MSSDTLIQEIADRFAALGAEPRLRLLRLLLACYPEGLIVGQLQAETGIPGSTLSHHLEKLKSEQLVTASREGTAWRYTANAAALKEMLEFLMVECCTRNRVVDPTTLTPKNCC